jgi:heme O synthase-like polyprenyltransferase
MIAWNALYGMWLLPYPPHGTDFVRLDHPWVLETLFSSRHGLLSWTPVLGLGFLGFGLHCARTKSRPDARKLFFASIIYLPLLFAFMMINRL